MEFFDNGRHDGGSFDAGIQFALERMLVDPDFLLRIHLKDCRAAASKPTVNRRLSGCGAILATNGAYRCDIARFVFPVEQHP